MEIHEIIQEVNGKTLDNMPKGSFSLLIDMWNTNNDNMKTVRDVALCKPELQIQRHGKYVQVDIIFRSAMDRDLETLWKAMEHYGDLLDKVEETSDTIPVATLTITSIEWEGYFHIVGVAPVLWTLQPQKPGLPASVLRIIYNDTDFIFYEDENLDLTKVRSEAEREVMRMEQEITRAEIEKAKQRHDTTVD